MVMVNCTAHTHTQRSIYSCLGRTIRQRRSNGMAQTVRNAAVRGMKRMNGVVYTIHESNENGEDGNHDNMMRCALAIDFFIIFSCIFLFSVFVIIIMYLVFLVLFTIRVCFGFERFSLPFRRLWPMALWAQCDGFWQWYRYYMLFDVCACLCVWCVCVDCVRPLDTRSTENGNAVAKDAGRTWVENCLF